jgi:hypothetical protein
MRHILSFLGACLLLLGAIGCESDNQPADVHADRTNDVEDSLAQSNGDIIAAVPPPKDRTFILPNIPQLEGRLLIVQGNTDNQSKRIGAGGKLHLARFDGQPPELLAERVSEPSVMASPSGQYVAYVGVEGYSWYLFHMDLQTREITPLQKLRNRFGFVQDWSPDEQWILFRNGGSATLSSIDGVSQFPLGEVLALWTTDNQLLVFALEDLTIFENVPLRVTDSYLLNPAAETEVPVDLGIEEIVLDAFPIERIIDWLQNSEGTAPAKTYAGGARVVGFPVLLMPDSAMLTLQSDVPPNSANVCNEWTVFRHEIGSNAPAQTLFHDNGTATVSDFIMDTHGHYLFQRWIMSTCRAEAENLRGEIIHVTTDGVMDVIVDDVYPGISTGLFRASTGQKFALSTDGQYMVYISGSLTTVTSNLKIINLETGSIAPLITWTADTPNDFLIWEAFNTVLWIP